MTAKRNTLIIGGLLAITAAFLIGIFFKDQPVAPPASVKVLSKTAAGDAYSVTEPAPSVQKPDVTLAYKDPNVRAQLFTEYRCQKSACDISPFIAENENEAVWLRQRGYPSEQQRKEAERLPTIELKLRADKGDQTAVSLYGERLIEEKNWKDAYGALLPASRRGNIYAMYALSKYSAEHPQHKSPLEARTWLRLAYLAGDYKSTMQLVQTYPEFNGTAEQLIVDRDAAHYYRQFLNYRTYPRPPPSE